MRIYKQLLLIIGISFLSLLSCTEKENSSSPSTSPINESDLIGTWQEEGATYSDEKLVLYSNHTFHQEFRIPETGYYAETRGTWELRRVKNGCVYVFLYEMKYFYQDMDLANNGNIWTSGIKKGQAETYWDECSESIIEMPHRVILSAIQFQDTTNSIILQHMEIQRDMTDIWLSMVER